MSSVTDSSWRQELSDLLKRSASAVDDVADIGLRRLRKRWGRTGIPMIQPYTGYATETDIRLIGRVLTNPPLNVDLENDRWWNNIAATVQRFASDEVPDVTVRAQLGQADGTTETDREGYFDLRVPRDEVGTELPFWSGVSLCITKHPDVSAIESATVGKVIVPPAAASFGLISDVDDTILHTGATQITTMAKLTFLANARTRAPLDGIAAWYEALQHHGAGVEHAPRNPIFYVSSSPWNLFDLLEDFMELNAIPDGPILLRDLGIDEDKFIKGGHDHKLQKARRIMRDYPDLPFVLSGDSGQEDARLYAEAAQEFGSRIRAIFIRDIDPDGESDHDHRVRDYAQQADRNGVPMFAIRDSVQAAEHCVDLGLLSSDAIDPIRLATQRDQDRKSGAMLP